MSVNDITFGTALKECELIEKNIGLCSNSSETRLFSRIGVLLTNDLQLIYELSKIVVRKDHLISTGLKEVLYFVEPCTDTNIEAGALLIIPSILVSGWKSLLNNSKSGRNVHFATSSKELDDALLVECDLLILSENLLPSGWGMLSNRRYNKIIVCNSSSTRVVDKLKSDFYWFAHSSMSQAVVLSNVPKEWHRVMTVEFLPPLSKELLVVQELLSETPIENLTLEGLVDDVVMNHLNSNDITRALQCISHKNLRSHRDVARHVLRNFKGSIGQLDAKIYTVEKMEYACLEEKTTRMQALRTKRAHLQTHHDKLVSRLENNDENCFICFQSACNICMTKCCSKRCCFQCIHKWFAHSRRCPMCNTSPTDVFVLKDQSFEEAENKVLSPYDEGPNKFENLLTLLNRLRVEDPNYVLICTSNTDQSRQISDVVDKCTNRKLILKRNFRIEQLRSGFCVIIQNTDKFPFPVVTTQEFSNVIFFDDRTFDLCNVFVREHTMKRARIWRLRYITRSGISVRSQNV